MNCLPHNTQKQVLKPVDHCKFSVYFHSEIIQKVVIFGSFGKQLNKVAGALQLEVVFTAVNYPGYPFVNFALLHSLLVFLV